MVMYLIENQGGFSSLERGTMVVANGQRGFHGLVVFLISSDKVLGSLIMKSRDCIVVTASSEKLTKQEKGYSLSNIMFSFMLSKPYMWAMPSSLDRYSVQGGQAAVAL